MSANNNPTDATGQPLTIERARSMTGDKRRRETAYRERAWRIALLQTCICTYPLDTFPTKSGHHEMCVSEAMMQSSQRQRQRSGV